MRTDLSIVQLPSPLPNWGGLMGTNTQFKDPDFATDIVRVTDGADAKFGSLQTASGGNAGIWNKNDTMLKVNTVGGKSYILQFDPHTMKRAAAPVAALSGKLAFSTVFAGVIYQVDGMLIRRLNFKMASGKWVLQSGSTVICDFSKIMPPGFKLNWTGTFIVSEQDKTFCLGFSEGPQNTAVHCCVFQKGHGIGKGYRLLNTQEGTIAGDCGEIGPINLVSPDTIVPFTLHECSGNPNPAYINVGAHVGGGMIWELATLKIVDSCISGHRAKGWLHDYAGGPGGGQYGVVPYGQQWGPNNGPNHVLVVPKDKLPASLGQKFHCDSHCGFGLLSLTDESIFWVSNQTPDLAPFPSAWTNEVCGYDTTTGTVYRACHTFNSGQSKEFIPANAIAVPSPTGRFIAFCSDGMGTLGSISGAAQGTLGVDCRADVFVARLVI